MKTRFEKAINSLYNAFFNGTLAKGTCTACAVGNIVADCMDIELPNISEMHSPFKMFGNEFWRFLFMTTESRGKHNQDISSIDSPEPEYIKYKEDLLNYTRYSAYELAKIEYAFETNTKIDFSKYLDHSEQEILEDQYNGLKAVVEVMMKLDNIEGTQYVSKFREHPKLQVTT